MSKRGDQILYTIRRDGKSYWVMRKTQTGPVPLGVVRPSDTRSGTRWDACDGSGETVYLEGRALPNRDAAAAVVIAHAGDN